MMRRVPFIPETLRLDQAMAEFKRQRAASGGHRRVRGTAGLVTLEDILEQLVGPVTDEFDQGEAQRIREEAPGTYVIDGLVPLDELREKLGLTLGDESYDTVGGMVFGRLGRVAKVGDSVDVEGYRFVVTTIDGRRVAQVRVQRVRQPRRVASA